MPVLFDWGYFTDEHGSFPQALLTSWSSAPSCRVTWATATRPAPILDQLGEEHMKTGKPIFYTSADSVFQIACHEETFGLDRLYELCEIAREEELTEGGTTSAA